MNNSWHPECFRCDLCQEVLADIGFVKNAGRYEQGTSPHKAGGWVGRVVPQGHLCSQVMHGQCGMARPVGGAPGIVLHLAQLPGGSFKRYLIIRVGVSNFLWKVGLGSALKTQQSFLRNGLLNFFA